MPIPIDPFLGHLMRTLFHLPEVMYEPFRNTFQALLVPRLQIAQQVQALVSKRLTFKFGSVVDPMQAGSAMPLFRQTPRRTLNGELVVRLLPQDFCDCQR